MKEREPILTARISFIPHFACVHNMRRKANLFLLVALLSLTSVSHAFDDFRGLWISRFEYNEDSIADITNRINQAADMGITDVFWQVRAKADAYYNSNYEPNAQDWQGVVDPLQTAINVADSRGVKIHAWLNTMPIWRDSSQPTDPSHVFFNNNPSFRVTDINGNVEHGFRPGTSNSVFLELLDVALHTDAPVLIHIDSGNERAMVDVCSKHPDNRFIFAHAGGNLLPHHVRTIIEECNNVLVEFSARDPWRYGGLTGDDGALLSGWHELVIDHPDRFATGTDPVWRVTRTQSWDQSDDGWDHFQALLDYHRGWIAKLPQAVQRKVSLDNARHFLGLN